MPPLSLQIMTGSVNMDQLSALSCFEILAALDRGPSDDHFEKNQGSTCKIRISQRYEFLKFECKKFYFRKNKWV